MAARAVRAGARAGGRRVRRGRADHVPRRRTRDGGVRARGRRCARGKGGAHGEPPAQPRGALCRPTGAAARRTRRGRGQRRRGHARRRPRARVSVAAGRDARPGRGRSGARPSQKTNSSTHGPMKRLVIVALAAAASSNLAAQDQSRDTARDTARVTPVIVTATRVPLSRAALPVAVTVVTGEELRARGIVRVSEAIENATSAYVAQSGSPGASTSLFLRGGESKYVKVLVDGVPANDPGGAYDFASLTTDNVERIEIVRGPASVLYGADAVTGVVHVITRRGAGPASGEVELSAGMAPRDTAGTGARGRPVVPRFDATARTSGGVGAGALAGSYSVALGHHASNGLYELNNELRDNVLSARGEFQPTSRTAARLSLRYTD